MSPKTTTGERVSTRSGGFNPTYQRHVAAYRLCAEFLPSATVLDVGCGVGHSFEELAPRPTVGVDIEPSILAEQARPTEVADMRSMPFEDSSFEGLISVHSIEHVPDPGVALAEFRRVLAPGGVAVLVTPNRLTFGRPDEIIDPYHYVEFDAREFAQACEAHFDEVTLMGLFGSARYGDIQKAQAERLDRLLRMDPLKLRSMLPRRLRQRLYDRKLSDERRVGTESELEIEPLDFSLAASDLDRSLDLVAICRVAPGAAGAGQ